MSNKATRVKKLIALDTELRYLPRSPNGSARISKVELDAIHKSIKEILKLDHIVAVN